MIRHLKVHKAYGWQMKSACTHYSILSNNIYVVVHGAIQDFTLRVTGPPHSAPCLSRLGNSKWWSIILSTWSTGPELFIRTFSLFISPKEGDANRGIALGATLLHRHQPGADWRKIHQCQLSSGHFAFCLSLQQWKLFSNTLDKNTKRRRDKTLALAEGTGVSHRNGTVIYSNTLARTNKFMH